MPPHGTPTANQGNPSTAAYYNTFTLSYYDLHVLGHNMTHLWRCPTKEHQLPLFQSHFWQACKHDGQDEEYGKERVAWEHLDVGAGTGFFVARALEQSLSIDSVARRPLRITLMDVNPSTLKKAKRRVEGVLDRDQDKKHLVQVATVEHGVLDLHVGQEEVKRYDVVTMFNLLHCLRTTTPEQKNKAFRFAAKVMKDEGVLVGCTILPGREYQGGGLKGVRARYTLWLYNRVYRVFGNEGDTREWFEEGLKSSFKEVEASRVGSVMFFVARKPKRLGMVRN